jgi:uncharacterized membrane protein YgaE (UPF0421/DUF939 family)
MPDLKISKAAASRSNGNHSFGADRRCRRRFSLPRASGAAAGILRAGIATLIGMQSTVGAAWTVSMQRLIGTALGAAMGALLGRFFGANVGIFGIGVFLLGVICAWLHIERSAYRYAGITLAVVMLIANTEPAWIISIHRFLEISVGIAAGLALTALWPEPQPRGV